MPEPQFSRRTEWDFHRNPLTQLADQFRRQGNAIHDWTIANPTTCGVPYDRERICAGLTDPTLFEYCPSPSGLVSARSSVARFLASRNVSVGIDRILLTASSSEGYSFLFRLLCNPGESVAIPKPGYPLFEDLARLNDVSLSSYRFHYAGTWHLDEESVRQAITPSTRAIVVVHPNNPTGNYLSPGEREAIAGIAREFGLPIIADEVFLTFPFLPDTDASSCAHLRAPLVFTLNGLSKLVGLPQMKLGWICVHGDEELAGQAMQRLEMIADTYLSVNTPVQVALPDILGTASAGELIRSRVAANYELLGNAMRGSPISVLHAEGGWNAIVQLPSTRTDEAWAELLLNRVGLLVHPGHLFDLALDAAVVVSLLPEAACVSAYSAMLRSVVETSGVEDPGSSP